MPDIAANSFMFSDISVADYSPIEVEHLMRQTMGDDGLAAEILLMFNQQCENCAKALDTGLSAAFTLELAHQMKGCARSVGCNDLADVAGMLEENPLDAVLYAELKAHCLQVGDFLNGHLKHPKP